MRIRLEHVRGPVDGLAINDVEILAFLVQLNVHGEALEVLHGVLQAIVIFIAHQAACGQVVLNVEDLLYIGIYGVDTRFCRGVSCLVRLNYIALDGLNSWLGGLRYYWHHLLDGVQLALLANDVLTDLKRSTNIELAQVCSGDSTRSNLSNIGSLAFLHGRLFFERRNHVSFFIIVVFLLIIVIIAAVSKLLFVVVLREVNLHIVNVCLFCRVQMRDVRVVSY